MFETSILDLFLVKEEMISSRDNRDQRIVGLMMENKMKASSEKKMNVTVSWGFEYCRIPGIR
jgi:hypothetical protein